MSQETTSFKAPSNKLGIWLNNYNGRYLCHFRQASADPQKPKQNYIFMDAALIGELLCCCALADHPGFEQEIVQEKESKGIIYLFKLVKRVDSNNKKLFFLQSQKTENAKVLSSIQITDFEEFHQVLLEVNANFHRVMFYKQMSREEQAKKQGMENLPREHKAAPEEALTEHLPQTQEEMVEEYTLIY